MKKIFLIKMKCKKKKHIFKPKSRKCICGKADIWWAICPRCKVNNVSRIPSLPCEDCLNDSKYIEEMKKNKVKSTFGIKFHKDAVAFVTDKKTGQEFAIDKKGKKFDPGRTRYDFKKDPHGWKAIGKKVRSKDRHGRRIVRQ